jgi:hypothetical protein
MEARSEMNTAIELQRDAQGVIQLGKPNLTADLLGQMLVLAWSKINGEGLMPDRVRLNKAILKILADAPEDIRDLIHTEDRIDGLTVCEITDFLVAAQRVGFIQRPNPSHVPCISKIDRFWAHQFLAEYEGHFSAELAWLQKLTETLSHT